MEATAWGYFALFFFIMCLVSIVFFVIWNIYKKEKMWALWTGLGILLFSFAMLVVCTYAGSVTFAMNHPLMGMLPRNSNFIEKDEVKVVVPSVLANKMMSASR